MAGDAFLIRSLVLLHLAFATTPVLAQNAAGAGTPVESAPPPAAEESVTPIISDEEFDAAIPSLDGKPLESVEEWQREQDARDEMGASEDVRQQTQQTAEESANPALRDGDAVEILSDPPVVDPLLDEPLPSIDGFDAEPPPQPTQSAENENSQSVRYVVKLNGLDPAASADIAVDADGNIYRNSLRRYYDLSALGRNGGRADTVPWSASARAPTGSCCSIS